MAMASYGIPAAISLSAPDAKQSFPWRAGEAVAPETFGCIPPEPHRCRH